MGKKHTRGMAPLIVAAAVLVAVVSGSASFANVLVAQDATTTATPVSTTPADQKTIDTNDCKNQTDNFKNWQRNITDRGREITSIEKETKTTATKAKELLATFTACVNGLTVCTPDFWTKNNECNDAQRNLEYELQDNLYPLRDCANSQRGIMDRRKEKKNNIDSQIKDILRNNKGADVSALTDISTKIDAQFAKADAAATCTGAAVDTLKDVSSELNTLFQDFYASSNDVRQASESVRRLADDKKDFESNMKRNCEKDKAREFKNYETQFAKSTKSGNVSADQQASHDAVKAAFENSCVTLIKKMQDALNAGDVNAFDDARQEYFNTDKDFWDTLNNNRQGLQEQEQKAQIMKNVTRDLQQKARDLKRMKSALSRVTTSYNKVAAKYLSKDERKQAAADLKKYIDRANELVNSISAGLAAADKAVKGGDADTLDEYWSTQQDLDEMRQEFDDLQRTAQMIPEVVKQLSNVEKQLKGAARERQGLPAELQSQFDEMVNTIKGSVDNAWSVLISDPEAAMEELQSMQTANQDWEETKNAWYQDNQGNNESGQVEPKATPLPYYK